MAAPAVVTSPSLWWTPGGAVAAADPWQEALGELRGVFVKESRLKLASVADLLDRLSSDPDDRDALVDLHRRFHGFAGSGASYGFDEVTRVGRAAERACQAVVEARRAPSRSEIGLWRSAEQDLRAQIDGALVPVHGDRAGDKPAPLQAIVVDDDPELCRIATRILELEGMVVRSASGRAQALAAFAERLPDVLLVDVVLNDGSGYDLVDAVRRRPDGDAPAVIMVSVRNEFSGRIHAATCGADGYFEKPVDWESLLRRVHHVTERSRAQPGRVLSLDDDPAELAFLRTVLESGGYVFEGVPTPERLEAALTSFKPDLVLMDVNLPGCTGYDLVRYLRQNERHATLPILFLTTENALGAHMEGARAGGDDHLLKPVSPGLLLSTVAARVERARFVKSLLERDGLTRLLTHTSCQERAKALAAQHQRRPEVGAAWVMLDLDNFKSVNDTYGHPTGDKVILSLANLLRRRLRQSDTVARYGGEEFVILIEGLQEREVVGLVERLLGEFRALTHAAPDGTRFGATFSAGVAMLGDDGGTSVEQWKQAADDALYRAKHAGRNRVVGASTPRPTSSGSGQPS